MLTYLRYALATVCFAASVGCLALWRWTSTQRDLRLAVICPSAARTVNFFANDGEASVGLGYPLTPSQTARGMQFASVTMSELEINGLQAWRLEHGRFRHGKRAVSCPLWYPALIFSLAGVGALRLGRRFTIRSAIIATTIVAGLLGMAVAL